MSALVEEARNLQSRLVEWRRYLHQHPEVGAEVPETAAFVAARLKDMGLSVRQGVGGHGVVGVLEGARPGPCFAIRADMDALSITEETGLPFASKYPGRMHACGHDGHMAMALGAAQVLAAVRDRLPGSVRFVFQPAEEGPGGAKPMIEDGVLENPRVGAIIGLHMGVIWDVPSGSVGVMPGPMMAAMDRVDITIRGKGGHGAMPHKTVDAVCVGSQVVCALQTVVSRRVSPLEPAVVTIGSFHSGTAFNIIAGTATLEGTVRCLSESLRQRMPGYIEGIVRGVASGMGAEYEFKYTWQYPVLENDPEFTEFFAGVAREVLGSERVIQLPEPTMGGEDMAFFLKEVPGTFFFLGSGTPERGTAHPHHNPRFDIDEEVLWIGTALFAETAWRWLHARA